MFENLISRKDWNKLKNRVEALEKYLAQEPTSVPKKSEKKIKTKTTKSELTQILGIGKVYAEKLKSLNLTRIEQIAQLNKNQIVEIEKIIPNKIKRDNWIGQAKNLLSK